MQQLPPFPDSNPPSTTPGQPSQPGQPSHAPSEAPQQAPDVDVPAPQNPGAEPPTTPISPVG